MRRSSGLSAMVAGLAAIALGRCSLIVGNFHECNTDVECPTNRVCQAHYCVSVPPGCNGVADAGVLGQYGDDAGNAIHFGALLNISQSTGINAARVQQLNALVLALNEMNESGISNRRFALNVCDTRDGTDSNLLASQVSWMSSRLNAPAVIVPGSGQVVAVHPSTFPLGMLLMSPTATSTEITALENTPDGGTRLMWRTAPSDNIQGTVVSDLLLGTSSFDAGLGGLTRVGILYEKDVYGQGLEAILLGNLSAAKTVQAFQYTKGGDFSSAVGQLDSFAPQLTVQIGFPADVARIVDAGENSAHLKRSDGHQWFFTDTAKDPATISGSPPGSLQGFYGTAPAQGAGLAYANFRNTFRNDFGIDPSSYAFTGNNYDAMYCLGLAAAYALGPDGTGPVTGATMAAGMTHLSSGTGFVVGPANFSGATTTLQSGGFVNLEGASGHLDFNPSTGEAPAPIELWQVDGGGFDTATLIDPGP